MTLDDERVTKTISDVEVAVHSKHKHAANARKSSLFRAVDTDDSGLIDKEEFEKLHAMISHEVRTCWLALPLPASREKILPDVSHKRKLG